MFTVDFENIVIDCGPCPICARLPTDPPLESSLNPVIERAILEDASVQAVCEAQYDGLDESGRDGGSLFDSAEEDDDDPTNADCCGFESED